MTHFEIYSWIAVLIILVATFSVLFDVLDLYEGLDLILGSLVWPLTLLLILYVFLGSHVRKGSSYSEKDR